MSSVRGTALRVGIDFDNTLVLYDRLFHRIACERYAMPEEVLATKSAVRTWFWDQPDGNTPWTELQGLVYGTMLDQAELAPGCLEFLQTLCRRGGCAAVISHKTEYPAAGPRVNLREAAHAFLSARALLRPDETGLAHDRVFFNSTREEKIERVAVFGCDIFIDDLPEVYAEPGFPRDVKKLLFDPAGSAELSPGVTRCRSWWEIRERVFPGSSDQRHPASDSK